eukprot:1154785-Pelagomonas_calceolata.AAC.1
MGFRLELLPPQVEPTLGGLRRELLPSQVRTELTLTPLPSDAGADMTFDYPNNPLGLNAPLGPAIIQLCCLAEHLECAKGQRDRLTNLHRARSCVLRLLDFVAFVLQCWPLEPLQERGRQLGQEKGAGSWERVTCQCAGGLPPQWTCGHPLGAAAGESRCMEEMTMTQNLLLG